MNSAICELDGKEVPLDLQGGISGKRYMMSILTSLVPSVQPVLHSKVKWPPSRVSHVRVYFRLSSNFLLSTILYKGRLKYTVYHPQ